ncbi:hypothetical protein BSKO_08303 [Bryopsis sp. KO-2023]|nr:hypothetical protein BSKO_08303 [Bryopsis sp. KO-2023]
MWRRTLEGHSPPSRQNIAGRSGVHDQSARFSRSLLQAQDTQEESLELWQASLNGDLERVKSLLDGDIADPDVRYGDSEYTPIILAAYGGHTQIVQELIRKGADVNAATISGRGRLCVSAIWMAAFGGHGDIVDELLKENANVNQKDSNDTTPLYVAAQHGHVDVVEKLVAANADQEVASLKGATPLMVAVEKGREGVTQILLETGADPNKKKKQTGQTSLWAAAFLREDKIMGMLVASRAKLDEPANDGTSPLYTSIARDCITCARILLEAGADVNLQRKSDKWSSLHAAAALGNVEAVELLLEFGADKTLQDHVLRRPVDVTGRQKKLDADTEKKLKGLLSLDILQAEPVDNASESIQQAPPVVGTSGRSEPPLTTPPPLELEPLPPPVDGDFKKASSGIDADGFELRSRRNENADQPKKSTSGSKSSLAVWAIIILAVLAFLVLLQAAYIVGHRRARKRRGAGNREQFIPRLHPRLSTMSYVQTSPVTVVSPPGGGGTGASQEDRMPFSPTQSVMPSPDSPETRRPATHPMLESYPSNIEDYSHGSGMNLINTPVNLETVKQLYTQRTMEYDQDGNFMTGGYPGERQVLSAHT